MVESFACPNCQATLDYDPQSRALTIRCTYCNSTVIVPDTLRNQGNGRQTPEVLAQVVQLVENGRKIEAIKLFREKFNVGLKEAKDVVDAIQRHEDIHLAGTNFHTASVTTATFAGTPTVQTSSGSSGCGVLIIALILIAAGAIAFFWLTPVERVDVVEQITTFTDSSPETSPSNNEITIVITTVEAALPGAPNLSTDSGFAEVVLQIGGEEGIGPGFFNDTRRLAVDGKGNIYTGDYSGGRVQVFDKNGEFLATWNAGTELYMSGMTVDRSGTVYIVNNHQVEKYNGMTGEFLGLLDLPNSATTYFRTAATGPDGSVYLVAEDRLVRMDNSGNIVLDLVEPFENIPGFATTQNDAAVDGAGNIYVLGRETVYKLNADGQFVDQIGSKGDAEDQFFSSPTALTVDGKGRIFVNDFNGIKVFEGNGRYLTTIPSAGVSFDMVVTDDNDLLVMDRNSNELRQYQLNQ